MKALSDLALIRRHEALAEPVKWSSDGYKTQGSYRGCRIDRTSLQSGGYFYYAFWSEHVNRAAPHSKMSTNYRSLASVKRFIDWLLEKETLDQTLIVGRLSVADSKALWDARGYNSPIGAGSRP